MRNSNEGWVMVFCCLLLLCVGDRSVLVYTLTATSNAIAFNGGIDFVFFCCIMCFELNQTSVTPSSAAMCVDRNPISS
jgi:TRAP-type C4-dicarboxylate transport system permease large subunit